MAKVTPPKLDVPTGVGVQLKRPPECLDDSSGKKARTEIAEQRIIECRRGCIRREGGRGPGLLDYSKLQDPYH